MNFALILFLLLVLTFVAWLAEKLVLRPGRERKPSAMRCARRGCASRCGSNTRPVSFRSF